MSKYPRALADASVNELTIGVGREPDGYDLSELSMALQLQDPRHGRG